MSGGPFVDNSGYVIGINSFVASSGTYNGWGSYKKINDAAYNNIMNAR